MMKQKLFSLLALVMTAMTASAIDVPTFSLTKAEGAEAHGTVKFIVDGKENATTAAAGKTVTVVLTPQAGWVASTPTGQWYATEALSRSAMPVLDAIELTPQAGRTDTWTFVMQRANAEIGCSYTKQLTHADITFADIAAQTYTGDSLRPALTVKDGFAILTEGYEYTAKYENNVNAGTATVTVTGKGEYTGTLTKTFTVAQATLTAVTLAETSLPYTKAEQTAQVAAVTAGDITVPADGYDVTGNKATSVGTYTVTVTGKGNFKGQATAQYSIVAADAASLTVTVAPASFIYDGTAHQPAVTAKDGSAVLTEGTDYTVAYTDNVNAGTATVTVTAKGNYAGTTTASFTIDKADAVLTAPTAAQGLVYNAKAQTLVSAGQAEGGELLYSADGETYSTTLPTATDAGTYTVYYKVTGDRNHNDMEPASLTVTVGPAALTAATLAKTNYIYNQKEQTASVYRVTAGTLTVPADGYDVTGNKATGVGNYTVTVTGKGNFTGEVTAQWSIVETGTYLFDISIAPDAFVYDGTEHRPAITAKDGSAVLTEGTDYGVIYYNNVNAGTATVVVTGRGNYGGTNTATFTIAKADITPTAPAAAEGLVYTGRAQTLLSAGQAEGGEMLYSADGENYSTTLPAATDAGTYTVYYRVAGDRNHNDVEPASLTVTVGPAALTAATLAQTELTYNGQEQTFAVGSVRAGDIAVPADGYDVTGNKATNAGTYTATVTGKGNFTGTATAQFTITPAAAGTLAVTLAPASFTYDGTAHRPAVTAKDGSAVLKESADFTVAYQDNVNAGTATVTVTGTGNYAGTATATFAIAPKTVGLAWGETAFDCDGTAKLPAVTLTGIVEGDECLATVEGAAKAVGTHTATVTALSNANYRLPEETATAFTIVRDMSGVFTGGRWATYVAAEDLAVPEGMEAYVVTGANGREIIAEAVGYIPAGVGVLLSNSGAAAFKAAAYEGEKTACESLLKGSATEPTALAPYEDYILYGDEFVLSSTATAAAGRACLPAAAAPAAAARLAIVATGDATTTGIAQNAHPAQNAHNAHTAHYDLSGRSVAHPAKKGIYISGGRKVVVK